MGERTDGYRGAGGAVLADCIELLGKAILSGIAASVILAMLALGLATTASAQSRANEAKTGTLFFRSGELGALAPAPKVETDVEIRITGIVARTRVAQTFHNPGAEPVEGIYVFPLPENAALVEQQRPNLFTNAVANIGPGEYVRVLIEYQQTLAWDSGEFRLRFPLAVTPRYEPAGLALPDEPKTAETLRFAAANGEPTSDTDPIQHPDYAQAGHGGVNPVAIADIIDSGVPLAKVASSYHEAWIEKESATRTVVHLKREQEEADRDFELVWAPQAGAAPQAAVFTEARNGVDYSLLMVMPPQPTAAERAAIAPLPRETVFVIDTSGSMQGTSITQAKLALQAGLATLTPRDRFNVVAFSSATRPLWPDALPATADNVKHAREWVGKLRADGGTEMAGAIAFALDGRETPGYLRQVVFMTDGAVGNEDQLFRLIAARLGATRLFTVGIGSAPNSHFMSMAAQFGRGTFTYIGDVREVEEKMARLFAKIAAPVLRDVAIRWPDGTAVETYPPRVPDLYLGEPIIVAAAHAPFKGTIVVSGMHGNLPWSVALTPSPQGEANGVGVLWARARIASLMDDLRLGADEAAVRPAVLKVALEHHLVSRYTSLVAVDVTPTAPAGAARTALVQAAAPRTTAAGELPQTDTESTLQIVLGLFALAAAGLVTLVGRAVPAGGLRRGVASS